jgi:6-phosphogluconolactonase
MNNSRGVSRSAHVLRFEPAVFADAAANRITEIMADTIRLRGHCTLALAGGATPRPVYERMATSPLAARVAWDRVNIYFGDERCVPPQDLQSNYRMAHEVLLQHVPVPNASVHRMEGERADSNAAAQAYEQLLPAELDLLLLGMGEDGHTASLFPRSPALAERTRRVVVVARPAPSPQRLTITPPVIEAADTVVVLVAGANKAAMVARALDGSYAPDELPIQHALRGTWLIDYAAARGLHGIPP